MNILVVEDDAATSAYLDRSLRALGHGVDVVRDGRDGLARGADPRFGCLVVDRMLPGYDGLTLVRALRMASVPTPIILLTAMGGVADRVQGLRAGADDYLVKPFDLEELAARIEAISRRPPIPASSTRVSAGGLELDRFARKVSLDGTRVELTASEFKILEMIVLNAGTPVTKAMLLESVFGLDRPEPSSIIEPHVSRLRAKLEKTGGHDPIRTVRGLGYLVDAD